MDSKCKQNTKPVKPTRRWKTNRYKRAKRRRLERKRFKKFINKRHRNITSDHIYINNSHISALVTSTMNTIPIPSELMRLPGSEWFLENYKFCQTWQEKHQNAVNKSRLAGLEYENAMLHKQMQQLREENQILKNKSTQLPSTSSNLPFYYRTCYPIFTPDIQQYRHTGPSEEYYAQGDFIRVEDREIDDSSYEAEDEENDNIEDDDKNSEADEVDDDFRKFLESTMRHRAELKKLREEQKKNDSEEFVGNLKQDLYVKQKLKEEQNKNDSEEFVDTKWFQPVRTDAERRVIMKRLYGDDAAMIHGMETALQLTFERHYDRNQPALWPNIAFRKPHFIVSS